MAQLNPSAGLAALVLLAAAWTGNPAPVAAQTCASPLISARGEPSSFEWLAKTKAQANWRSRVRATRDLGAAYATWSLAQ